MRVLFCLAAGSAALVVAGCDELNVAAKISQPGDAPRVVAASDIAAGKYLVQIGGCNDCHTKGYAASGGQVAESEWLTGNDVGYRGPWGTTYGRNLRRSVAAMTEDEWAEMLATRKAMPIMPWPSVNAMSDADRRAIYRYIKSLPLKGDEAPATVPPGQEPKTAYEDLNTVQPKAAAAAR